MNLNLFYPREKKKKGSFNHFLFIFKILLNICFKLLKFRLIKAKMEVILS